MFNLKDEAALCTVDLSLFGAEKASARDLWAHRDMGVFEGEIPVELDAHGAAVIKLGE